MALNSELKSRRVAAGLTQQALAARIGIDHATISHVEKGRRAPSVAVLEGWVRETGGAPVVFDAHNAPGTEADDHDAAVQGPWKAWMQRARLNQAKVAEKTGISQSMISKVFAGKCRPSVPTLSALCSVLGLSSEEAIQAIGSKIADSAGGDVRIVADPVPRSIVADLRASAAARTSGPSAQKPRDTAGGHSQFDVSVARWTGNLSDTGMAAAYVRDLLSLVQDAVAELWGTEAAQDRTLVLAVFDRIVADRDRRIAERAQ